MKLKQIIVGTAVILASYTVGKVVGFVQGSRRVAKKVFELTDLEEIRIPLFDDSMESSMGFSRRNPKE